MNAEEVTRSVGGVLKLRKVELPYQVGKFPAGTHFDWAFLEPDGFEATLSFFNEESAKRWIDGKLELVRTKKLMGVYRLAMTMKEVINEA